MAITHNERVGKALILLKEGLVPFVEREFKARFGDGVSKLRVVSPHERLRKHEFCAQAGG